MSGTDNSRTNGVAGNRARETVRRFTWDRSDILLWAAVLAVAVLLRIWGLGSQPPTLDDVMVPITAKNYVLHGQPGPVMPFHPNMRNLLVFVSTWILGTGVAGVKGWSVLLGALSVPVLGLIVLRLTRSRAAAVLAAGLLALDAVHVDFSRQAIQETHTTFFFLVGTWLAVEALLASDRCQWPWLLIGSGVAFGFGIASKAHAFMPLLVSLVLLSYVSIRRKAWADALLVASCLVVLPFTVYLATYIPWFLRGYGLGEWFVYQGALLEVAATHTRPELAAVFSRPYEWFVRPFVGYADYSMAGGSATVMLAVTNPVVWLTVLPAAIRSVWLHRTRRADFVLQTYFWVAYLPLLLASRPIWLLSALAVVPYAFALVAIAVTDIARRTGAWVFWGFAAAAMLSSLLLYPLATGQPADTRYLAPVLESLRSGGLLGGASSGSTIP